MDQIEQRIFHSTKAMLDISGDDESFDSTIMTFINGALADLLDLGVGPEFGLVLVDGEEVWSALQETAPVTESIKNWLYLKVRKSFDPPQVGFLMTAHQTQIDEATWRLVNKKDGERYKATHPEMVETGEFNG